ncbi:MAG: helicase-related protein, partial [Bradymonadaceae bacterium]
LIIEYTLRRWESGPSALLETLEGLVDFHERWLEARREGRTLNHRDYRELFDGERAGDQEVFPFLYPSDGDDNADVDGSDVRADLDALRNLRRRVAELVDDGSGRLSAVAQFAGASNSKILVFTRFRRPAEALFEMLRDELGPRGRVGLVTGDRAVATGLGRSTSEELQRRFAPRAQTGKSLPEHQQLRVLVSTDCLSEGVNLQDCGTIVLADLPYSPLAVEQRIGRLVRPGGPHDRVQVYLPRPENWNDTLGLRRQLQSKLADARRSGLELTAASVLDRTSRDPHPQDRIGDSRADRGGTAIASNPSDTTRGTGDDRPTASPAGPGRLLARGTDNMQPSEPLAALTRLDEFRRRIDTGTPRDLEHAHWRVEAPVPEPRLWVYICASARRPDPRWWLIGGDGVIETRLGALLPGLVALYDESLALEATKPAGPLWNEAYCAVDEREEFLEGARLAPEPLDLQSPQHRIWQRIRALGRDGANTNASDDLDQLRRRLLRPFPRGIEQQLERLADADRPAKLTYRRTLEIIESVPTIDEPVELEIATGVELQPD